MKRQDNKEVQVEENNRKHVLERMKVSLDKLPLFFLLRTFFKRFYLFIFRERGKEGRRGGEKHQCVVASHVPPTGDMAHNLGMCPDWDLN